MANLSQQKRQRMMNFLSKLKEEHKDDDSVSFPLLGRIGDFHPLETCAARRT